MSMRIAASCGHERHDSSLPLGARTSRISRASFRWSFRRYPHSGNPHPGYGKDATEVLEPTLPRL